MKNALNKKQINQASKNSQHDNRVTLPKGLFGFNQEQQFELTTFRNNHYAPFKMLYNCKKPELSFILLPSESLNGYALSDNEKEKTAQFYGITTQALQIFYLVSIQKNDQKLEITANLRAPIIIDKDNKLGWQHILENTNYTVDYPLNEIAETIQKNKHD